MFDYFFHSVFKEYILLMISHAFVMLKSKVEKEAHRQEAWRIKLQREKCATKSSTEITYGKWNHWSRHVILPLPIQQGGNLAFCEGERGTLLNIVVTQFENVTKNTQQRPVSGQVIVTHPIIIRACDQVVLHVSVIFPSRVDGQIF